MPEAIKEKRTVNWRLIAIIVAIILMVLAIGLYIAHEVIEAKIFGMILNQPGYTITIGSRHGNLFSGYTLDDVSVHRSASPDMPATGFTTDQVVIRWRLRPLMLTRISWAAGNYTVEPPGAAVEEIPVGAGNLTLGTTPEDKGWLISDAPITLGPDSWKGTAELRIRADMQQLSGKVEILNLPSRYLTLATSPPQGFAPLGAVELDLNLSGSPQDVRASGMVMDTFTGQAFRF
jgi:hypothetical protein